MSRPDLLATAQGGLRGAWQWWTGELAALVPTTLRQHLAGWRSRLLLLVDAAGDNLIEESGTRRHTLGRIDLDPSQTARPRAILATVPRPRAGGPAAVIVRLGEQHALRTSVSLPLAAEKNLTQVVGFEFERIAPFKRDDVHYAYRILARDRALQTMRIELSVLPRAELAHAAAALDRLGLRMSAIEIGDNAASAPVATIAFGRDDRPSRRPAARRLVFALGTLATALAIACLAIPLWRAHAAIDALTAQVADARRQAEAAAGLEKQIDAARQDEQFLIGQKNARPTVTELLATLTRLTPDNTYLTELDVTGGQTHLTGVTASATALLALIDQSGSFRNAAFQSSITQDPRSDRERFDIAAKIAPRSGP